MVTGFPLLFNGTDSNVLTFFTGAEMARLNDATEGLNTVIQERATVSPPDDDNARGGSSSSSSLTRPLHLRFSFNRMSELINVSGRG